MAGTGGTSLVFVTYPAAIDTMAAPNFWVLILSLTLFMLGLDSAFAMIEAPVTVIYDAMKNPPHRAIITAALCIIGFCISLLFCTNWGFILFDAVDYYLSNYLLYLVGLLETFGVGWMFDNDRTAAMSENWQKAERINFYGFWLILAICGLIGVANESEIYGMLIFISIQFIAILPWSFITSEGSFSEWYDNVLMSSVKRISISMSKLARLEEEDPTQKLWWEDACVFYFGFTVKYLNPMILWFVILYSIKSNMESPYGGYAWYW